MNTIKYANMPKVPITERNWPSATITQSPAWCAVDLRDGNQALPNPMTPDQKKEYFQLLVDIGFKEIEVGFPSASQDDFQFVRDLIEQNMIPDDVTISVLTQARSHLIERTMESIKGIKQASIHFYTATSPLHMHFIFELQAEAVLQMVADATVQIREAAKAMPKTKVSLEFSPEEFTDSDLDFTVKICDVVVEKWHPADGDKIIMNLPATVERRLPNEYADMIEEFIRRQAYPEKTIISVHTHNDMGCGVASTMQSLLAGADRVEGTLFGHGERTGNVDLATVALNLEYMNIDTGLNFSNLDEISATVERVTNMTLHPRHPYAGELVFTAFSGSHQDAIHKGFNKRDELTQQYKGWKVPYLHIAPESIGRSFESFIRINSQSGKGGVAHILQHEYNIGLPKWAQVDFAGHVQKLADSQAKELSSLDLFTLFEQAYLSSQSPIELVNYWPRPADDDPETINGEAQLIINGKEVTVRKDGNGPISAFVHGIKSIDWIPDFNLLNYEEDTMGKTADAKAISYVRIEIAESGSYHIGIGIGSNIDQSAVRAVLCAVNSMLK
jgi:2-isopropylmalate synthase